MLKKVKVSCTICQKEEYSVIAEGPDFEYNCSKENFQIVKCNDCGMVFLNPRPDSSEINVIYPSDYIPYKFNEHLGSIMGNIRDSVQKKKVDALRPFVKEDSLIVDVGCGGGYLLRLIKKFGDNSWNLQGIDLSFESIEYLRKNNIKGICGRFETMNLPNSTADMIIMNQVIEHLDDPMAVVKKCHEYLKDDGYLFIETPNVNSWDCKIFNKRHWGGWHFPRHWHLFNPKTLKIMLERCGFEVFETKYLLSPNFWAQSFHHYFIDKGISEKFARFFDCKNIFIMALFSFIDLIQISMGKGSSNMRMVARKK